MVLTSSCKKYLLSYWIKTLHLEDWKITFYPEEKQEDLGDTTYNALTTWEESNKTAVIQILNPKEADTNFDYEETLVHELLHLKFCLLHNDINDFEGRYIHQIIDDIAKALIKVRREKDD